MRVDAVDLFHVRIPLKRAFRHAAHERATTDTILVKVTDEHGTVGWGETIPRAYVTGETVESVLERSGPALARGLVGRELADLATAVAWVQDAAESVGADLATLCGFDLAVLDAAGRRFGTSIVDVLGGAMGSDLPAGAIIGFEHPTDKLARYCAALRLGGKTHIKVKVGLDDDAERLAAVAKVFKQTPLRLDANAAWTAQEAVAKLRELAAVAPIASVEQPVAAADVEGLGRVRHETGLRVMADESVCSLADAERLAAADAVDILNVRLGKNGGLLASAALCAWAKTAGVAIHLGTMVGETGVLSRASELFGRCIDGFECLDGKGQNEFLLEVDIIEKGSDYPPDLSAPGLGLTVDEDTVRAHATDAPRRVT